MKKSMRKRNQGRRKTAAAAVAVAAALGLGLTPAWAGGGQFNRGAGAQTGQQQYGQQRDQQFGQQQYGWQQTQPGTWERRDERPARQYQHQEGPIRGDGEPRIGSQPGQQQYGYQQPMLEEQRHAGQEQHIPTAQLSSEKIREVQQKLNDRGFNQAKVDGNWGPGTQAAVRDFQKSQGIEVTGQLNPQTLNELGLDAEDFREATKQAGLGVTGQPKQMDRR